MKTLTFTKTTDAYRDAGSGDRFSVEVLDVSGRGKADRRALYDLVMNHAFDLEPSSTFAGVLVERKDRSVVLVYGTQDLAPGLGMCDWADKVRELVRELGSRFFGRPRDKELRSAFRKDLKRLCGL